jgi:hypothetical protein
MTVGLHRLMEQFIADFPALQKLNSRFILTRGMPAGREVRARDVGEIQPSGP